MSCSVLDIYAKYYFVIYVESVYESAEERNDVEEDTASEGMEKDMHNIYQV